MVALAAAGACKQAPSSSASTGPATGGGDGSAATQPAPVTAPAERTGPVAASCKDTPCFEADAAAKLSCKRGPMNKAEWQSSLEIKGQTDRGGCVVYRDANGADINLQVLPMDQKNHSELFIRLHNYAGPGRYKLVDEEDRGGAGRGFFMRVNGGVPDAHSTMGATKCTPGCEAFLTSRSEPIAATGQLFRLDIDVICGGGSLDDGTPCNDHAACALDSHTVHVEALCKGP